MAKKGHRWVRPGSVRPLSFLAVIDGATTYRVHRVVKSWQKSDRVCHRQASTRSSARKPGYLTFPVVELRVSVA